MAANKKNSNTNRTAHVMNLLSKNKDAAPADAEAELAENLSAPQPDTAPKQTKNSSTPPVIASMASDAAVSEQIKSALEEALENELNAPEEPLEAPERTRAGAGARTRS